MPNAGSRAGFLPLKFLDLRRFRFGHCPRPRIDPARRGAWSAETTHAPRVPDMAVAAHRRAQPISKTFSRGVTSARADAPFKPFPARRAFGFAMALSFSHHSGGRWVFVAPKGTVIACLGS